MARVNKSRYAILNFLSKASMSGYDIKALLEKISSFYWSESNAQIYPLLKQMKEEKVVTSKIDEKSGARKRCVYSITKKGLDELKEWLLKPIEYPKYREEILLKLNAGHNVPIEATMNHIKECKEQLLQKKKLLCQIEDHIRETHADKPEQPFLFMTYDYYEIILNAKLQWCEKTIKALQRLKQKL